MLQSGESGSRTDITLPEPQKQLLHEIKALDKKIVLVLFNGRPLALTDIIEDCDAVLEAWFPGTAGGLSICDCLFGDYNPSGRLTVSSLITLVRNHYIILSLQLEDLQMGARIADALSHVISTARMKHFFLSDMVYPIIRQNILILHLARQRFQNPLMIPYRYPSQ